MLPEIWESGVNNIENFDYATAHFFMYIIKLHHFEGDCLISYVYHRI